VNALPTKVGKYQITEELGRGSMGIVCARYDPFADSQVAIKIAHPTAGDSIDVARMRKIIF
jgi:hypothetical protein